MNDSATRAVAVAMAAGVCGAIQPKINAVLGARVGSALIASLVNFTAAFVLVVVAVSLRPATRRRLLDIGSWPVPRWTLTAGIGGAVIVVAGAVSVQTIGVAVFSVSFFAGQIIFGLFVDRLGVAPGGKRPITPARLQAVLLAAGAAFAFQSSFNARIALATGDPVAATAVNVVVGTAALTAVIATLGAVGILSAPQWPSQPWLYTGGALGVTVVRSLSIADAALGVLRATMAMLAAQMIAALCVDWAIAGEAPTLGVVGGAALTVAAVAVVGRRSTPHAAIG